MIRTQVQIEEGQIEWLRMKARDKGVSVSQMIRESIDHFKINEERLPTEKKARAMQAVGRFSSDCSDISQRHDDYLSEAYLKKAEK